VPATPSSVARAAAAAATGVAWVQWSALTSAAVPEDGRAPASIVDPEALVLVSLAFRDDERRLADVLAGWMRQGSRLLSVRRMQTLAASYPAGAGDALAWLASVAAASGDRRWTAGGSVGSTADRGEDAPRAKPGGPLRLGSGPALMLRLRAAFGVGAKADVLTFLLGLRGAPATLRTIAAATGYTTRAIRTAAEEMTLAEIVDGVPGQPVEYLARHEAWAHVFGTRPPGAAREEPPRLPPWKPWASVFLFLAGVESWARDAADHGWSEYVASSRARDLAEKHTPMLRRAGIAVPRGAGRGAEYLGDFAALVQSVDAWMHENV
jgi:hypothetical protein